MTQDKPPSTIKTTSAEQRQRRQDRLVTIRLRMAIGRALDDRGITTPTAIGVALGMPADEAVKLLTRRQWREEDVVRLEEAVIERALIVLTPAHSGEARCAQTGNLAGQDKEGPLNKRLGVAV